MGKTKALCVPMILTSEDKHLSEINYKNNLLQTLVDKPDFVFWNDYFPQNYIDKLLDIIEQQETEEALTNDSRSASNEIRKSKIKFVIHPSFNDSNLRLICLETLFLIQKANIVYNFDIDFSDHIVQLTKYSEQGSYYDWHKDSNILFRQHPESLQRKLSCTILLKEAKEGGIFETELGTSGYNHKAGSVIVFPSFLKHMVTPVIRGERISIVSWTCGPEWK